MINNIEDKGFGKLPPQARDIEELVLGAMMLELSSVIACIAILRGEMFYLPAHQIIFNSIVTLFNKNNPIDISTVCEEIRKEKLLEEVGGAFYISELTNRVASTANVEYHCRIIYQKFLSRELIRISYETLKMAYDDDADVLDLVDATAKKIISLSDVEANHNTEPYKRITKAINQIEAARQSGNSITGIRSGLMDIDKITGGWQKQDLIVIAGRPGCGKSALAIKLGIESAISGVPAWMFSLEMSDAQIAMREMGMETHLKYSKLRKGEVNQAELSEVTKSIDTISNRPFYVDSASKLNLTILRTKLLKAIHEKHIKLAIVDYLNLMENDSMNKYATTADKISEICKELKRTAKQFDIPIILLAQLNRDVEKESDKRPKLHHLKSSGAIEEYSDMVLLLYRPAYYYKNTSEPCPEPNTLYIDIAKHKQGATGDVPVYCEIDKNIITDLREVNNFRPLRTTEYPVTNDAPF